MKKITILVADIITTAFIVIDLFCGAGGTTTGFVMTKGLAKVVACVNHDKKAIQSHWMNNPEVKHFEEDIRTLDLTELIALVKHYRALYPNAKVILWASLECTNFSKAKGGQARDADSRTLANHLVRYITAINPDIIQIENVVEFMSWGPLDENGKPESKNSGKDFMRWKKEICELGYFDEWKQLNSADFGAYTSRNRLFGMFAKDQSWITWPEPTHFKKPSTGNLFNVPNKWKPVKEVLDLADEGNSIFGRKKNLSEKTLDRIYAGLVKYVAAGDSKSFIAKYYSGRPAGKVISINGPAGVITTVGNQTLVNSCFLGKYYGNGHNIQSIDEPAGTIPTKDRFAKFQSIQLDKKLAENFILKRNSSTAPCLSIESPSPTITQRGQVIIKTKQFIVNPAWGGNPGSVDNPCCTIVARQDKAPLYLVATESGELAIEVYDTDSPATIKIKEFMAAYGIVDIKMRMLKVPELLKIQGFPDDYMLFGNQTDQKKFIGNSVVPLVVKCWIESIGNGMEKLAA